MSTYLIISISLLIMGLWFESINSINEIRNRKRLPNYLFILPSFTLLFFFSAFRGDFNPDYTNYTTIFQLINSYSFIDAFKVGIDIEFGFLLLNRLIGVFSSNVIYLFIITSFVIDWILPPIQQILRKHLA